MVVEVAAKAKIQGFGIVAMLFTLLGSRFGLGYRKVLPPTPPETHRKENVGLCAKAMKDDPVQWIPA